jgi:hypothetical protein
MSTLAAIRVDDKSLFKVYFLLYSLIESWSIYFAHPWCGMFDWTGCTQIDNKCGQGEKSRFNGEACRARR